MKQVKNIQEQVQKELPDFASEVASLSPEELNGRLAQNAKDLSAVEQAKESDLELEEAQAALTVLRAPYSEAKKLLALKRKYIISLLNDKGAL